MEQSWETQNCKKVTLRENLVQVHLLIWENWFWIIASAFFRYVYENSEIKSCREIQSAKICSNIWSNKPFHEYIEFWILKYYCVARSNNNWITIRKSWLGQ